LTSERELGGITLIKTEHGLPAAGAAVTVHVAPAPGEVQTTVVPLTGATVPLLAVHAAEAEEVISTCSLTPTVLRVSAVPSGADAKVLVVMVHLGGGGDGGVNGVAGAGVGTPPGKETPASLGVPASSDCDTGPGTSSTSSSSVVRPLNTGTREKSWAKRGLDTPPESALESSTYSCKSR